MQTENEAQIEDNINIILHVRISFCEILCERYLGGQPWKTWHNTFNEKKG